MRQVDKSLSKSVFLSCAMGAGLLWGASASAQPALTATPLFAQSVQVQTLQHTGPMVVNITAQPLKADLRVEWRNFKRVSARKTVDVRRSLRRSLKKAGTQIPGISSLKWADRNMGMPAILLILSMLSVFGLLMMSGPLSRTGGHH